MNEAKQPWRKPIWEGDIVWEETVLFITGRSQARLLYPIEEIVSVTSYDRETVYQAGKDYTVTDGYLSRPADSAIPVYDRPLVKQAENDVERTYCIDEEAGTSLAFIDDHTYPKYAVLVTYRHTVTWPWGGYEPAFPEGMVRCREKLERGEPLHIVIYGDSISCGWSASGLNAPATYYDLSNTEGHFKPYVLNFPPYTPPWMEQLEAILRETYPQAKLTISNIALGGTGSPWGMQSAAARLALCPSKPDLVMIGFGGNDITGRVSPETHRYCMEQMIATFRDPAVQNGNPDAEVLLYSCMTLNPLAKYQHTEGLLAYERELQKIAAETPDVQVMPITSFFASLDQAKEAIDRLNTNVNHGNDFTARVYAKLFCRAFGVKH